MTALNAIRYDDAAVILTDGASYDRQGIVRRIGPKCQTIKGPNIVLAVSGASAGHKALARLLARDFEDIDHISAEGGAWFQDWHAVYADFLEEQGGREILVAMAGWSTDQDRARLVMFASELEQPFGEPATIRMPLMGEAPIDRSRFDVMRDGVALVERQRLYRGEAESDADRASGNLVVGGHVMLTLVRRTGITHQILKTWPEDRVGHPIRPAAGMPAASASNVIPLPAQNRAERRRQAKMTRECAA
ncbi:hypothetical protein [Antarcticirhabdus aurantiaca]|uniref:Uncharacterized protein n=1 Tax=Antarcticirhabdus aurantiaca TaxID=2606717 RepID=A0ACD4NX52_9HYPH|nr:hypothetical protein [Antarcticirhabdus aurantiaca]WAJ31152.1 hypothetical protein OXU80_13515 [Jeongeuplla avenae]